MPFECLSFWLLGWLGLELAAGRFVAQQLLHALLVVLTLSVLVWVWGFDLFALFIAATYASAFIAMALIALQFGPFWAPAARQGRLRGVAGRCGALVGLLGVALVWGELSGGLASSESWDGCLLWQDTVGVAPLGLNSQMTLLHWYFYRVFVLETFGLNVLLFVGLVAVLGLLSFLERAAGGRSQLRPRLGLRLRRQVRRSAASRLRYRALFNAS